MSDRYERVEVTSRAELRAWLEEHHAGSPGIWLVTFKKAAAERHVPYGDIVEEALSFGWVDSRPQKLDGERSMLLLTPRRRGSGWSRANKERIERLDAAGLLTPAGRAVVDAARADGSWARIDHAQDLREPDDLREALEAHDGARGHWDAFPPSTRRAILEWIGNAKRPETRSRRVRETATLAAQGVRANQWRRPGGR